MQTAPVRKEWTGKRHGSSVLFTHHDPGCSRRVPYWRPRGTPLYEERLSRLCENRMNLPVCPQRSRARPAAHHDCCPPEAPCSEQDGDTTQLDTLLSSLPRPASEKTVADIDFPDDLEQSFITGALNLSTHSLTRHSLPPRGLPQPNSSFLSSHGNSAVFFRDKQPTTHHSGSQKCSVAEVGDPLVPDQDDELMAQETLSVSLSVL